MSLEQIYGQLGEISGKMDMLLERMPALEGRVATLESFKSRVLGAFSVVSLIVGTAVTWFIHGRK